jgi:hypothetical protein
MYPKNIINMLRLKLVDGCWHLKPHQIDSLDLLCALKFHYPHIPIVAA